MYVVFCALLPVFLAIASGYLLRLSLLPNPKQWEGMERLTYYVLIPAMLVEALARTDLSRVPIVGVGAALFLAVIAMSILMLLVRPALVRLDVSGATFTSMFQGATRWNAMVVLAVAASLFGDVGIAVTTVAVVVLVPVLNVINVLVLTRYAQATRPSWGGIAKALLENPMIWSCAAGIALYAINPPIPEVIWGFVKQLGRMSVMLGLLLVGSGLTLAGLRRPSFVTLLTTVLKLMVMPAFAASFGVAFDLSGTHLAVVLACAAVPTASSAYLLARQMGGDGPVIAQIITVQTIAAMVTMPVLISLAT
jgi:malonate transporter and related proteins